MIFWIAASAAVTAGLKCAPEAPPSEWMSIIRTKTWTRPMTAKSVTPRPAATDRTMRDEEDEHERAYELGHVGNAVWLLHWNLLCRG